MAFNRNQTGICYFVGVNDITIFQPLIISPPFLSIVAIEHGGEK